MVLDFPNDRQFKEQWILRLERLTAHAVLIHVSASFSSSERPILVLTGSEFSWYAMDSIKDNHIASRIRPNLVMNGCVGQKENGDWIFLKDVIFSTPSTAACVITGTSVNGRILWRYANGPLRKDISCISKSLKEFNPNELIYYKRPKDVFDTCVIV